MDNNSFGERDSSTPAGWSTPSPPAPPSPSIAEPVLSGDYGQTSLPAAPPAPASSKLPWFAAVAGALVLLVGGGFFALTAFAASGGADSPEAAADAMIEAANNEDFITIAELLEPSERRTIAEPMITEVLPELIRLGVLDDTADAGGVDGVDWEFTDVTYRVDPIAGHADMVHVFFTGGQAAAEFNSAEFPFSDAFRDRFGDEIEDEPRTTEELANAEVPMVFVERDGRWYMSAMFTIAENARIEAGESLPSMAAMPPALGSPSPEAAVEAMITEMVELDLAGMIGRMDPEEMAVLYRYAPLFLQEGQDGLDELSNEMSESNASWDITEFDFDVDTDGDDASVAIRGFRFELTADEVDLSFTYGRDRISATIDAGDSGRGSLEATPTSWVIEGVVEGDLIDIRVAIDPDGTMVSVEGSVGDTSFNGEVDFDEDGVCSRYSASASDGTNEQGCLEDQLGGGSSFIVNQYIGFFDNFGDEFGGGTVVARQTGGEWYVSPVTTVLDYYIDSLQQLDEGEFEKMLDSFDAASMAGFGALDTVDGLGGGDPFSETAISDDAIFDDEMFDDLDNSDFDSGFDDGGFGEPAMLNRSSIEAVPPGERLISTGSIEPGFYDEVQIDVAAGDVLTITLQADPGSDLDTTLELFDPTGGNVASNDDADSSVGLGLFDSFVEFKVETAGVHVIEVRSFGDFGGGGYTLTVDRS